MANDPADCIRFGGIMELDGGTHALIKTRTPSPSPAFALPTLIASAEQPARVRYLEFFAATIRNPHTRRAYARSTVEFLGWCSLNGVIAIGGVAPLHVAAWIEAQGHHVSAPTVKQQLVAIRHLFDWLVMG